MRRAKTDVEFNIKTGIKGLDEILLGGFKKNNVILIEGDAGAGKTTLGLEFIYKGASEFKENGLVISFELTPEKLMRDSRSFGWDFAALEKKGKLKIIYLSPMAILRELHKVGTFLKDHVEETNAKRILIDGLTPLRVAGEIQNDLPYRSILYNLVESLQQLGVTSVLTKEVSDSTLPSGEISHERFVCDTILTLTHETNRRNTHRYIEIKKSRGQDFIPGQHTLRIEDGKGICVYRRTQSRPKEYHDQVTSTKKLSCGINSMNPLLGGGIYMGSISLLVGISGTGKTIMGMHFLLEGAKNGEPGLLLSLDEHPQQLMRNADSMGLNLREYVDKGLIHIYYESPLELELDVHFNRIMEYVEEKGIKRVVVDSLAEYENSTFEDSHEFMYALSTYFKNSLVTAFMNYESPELLGVSQISQELKASAIVDNIILLNYVEISTQMRRAVTVPKVRGSAIPQKTRELIIETGGMRLIDENQGINSDIEKVPQLPFGSYYGVLSRAPARKSPVIDEKIVSGNDMPDSTM